MATRSRDSRCINDEGFGGSKKRRRDENQGRKSQSHVLHSRERTFGLGAKCDETFIMSPRSSSDYLESMSVPSSSPR